MHSQNLRDFCVIYESTVVVVVVVVLTSTRNSRSPRSRKGAGALGRSEKPLKL